MQNMGSPDVSPCSSKAESFAKHLGFENGDARKSQGGRCENEADQVPNLEGTDDRSGPETDDEPGSEVQEDVDDYEEDDEVSESLPGSPHSDSAERGETETNQVHNPEGVDDRSGPETDDEPGSEVQEEVNDHEEDDEAFESLPGSLHPASACSEEIGGTNATHKAETTGLTSETCSGTKRRSRWEPRTEGSTEGQDKEGLGSKKRKSRWEDAVPSVGQYPDFMKTLFCAIGVDPEIQRLNIELLEISRRLQTGQLYDEGPDGCRSPSPEPTYDTLGIRINTREYRAREKLNRKRQEIIAELIQKNPAFKPPPDYKTSKFQKKLYIPVKEHPGYNFIGLIIGPRGNTQKRMEKETGARILLRGKGSTKDGRMRTSRDPTRDSTEDDDLHVLVEADTRDALDKAAGMIEKLLIPVDEGSNDHKRAQLRELAALNGTLRDDEGHTAVDSAMKGSSIANTINGAYNSFLAQLGGGPLVNNLPVSLLGGSAYQSGQLLALPGPSEDRSRIPFFLPGPGAAASVTYFGKEAEDFNVYVAYLATFVDEGSLIRLFAPFGHVEKAKVIRDGITGLSKEYAFVKFADLNSATSAVILLNGFTFHGKTLALRVVGHPLLPNAQLLPPADPTGVGASASYQSKLLLTGALGIPSAGGGVALPALSAPLMPPPISGTPLPTKDLGPAVQVGQSAGQAMPSFQAASPSGYVPDATLSTYLQRHLSSCDVQPYPSYAVPHMYSGSLSKASASIIDLAANKQVPQPAGENSLSTPVAPSSGYLPNTPTSIHTETSSAYTIPRIYSSSMSRASTPTTGLSSALEIVQQIRDSRPLFQVDSVVGYLGDQVQGPPLSASLSSRGYLGGISNPIRDMPLPSASVTLGSSFRGDPSSASLSSRGYFSGLSDTSCDFSLPSASFSLGCSFQGGPSASVSSQGYSGGISDTIHDISLQSTSFTLGIPSSSSGQGSGIVGLANIGSLAGISSADVMSKDGAYSFYHPGSAYQDLYARLPPSSSSSSGQGSGTCSLANMGSLAGISSADVMSKDGAYSFSHPGSAYQDLYARLPPSSSSYISLSSPSSSGIGAFSLSGVNRDPPGCVAPESEYSSFRLTTRW